MQTFELDNLLTINADACQQCGICAESCPVSIISLDQNALPFVAEENKKRCVLCGHCEAICSTQALKNNRLPQMQLIQNDKLQYITPENISEYFRTRRSIRTFLPKAVSKSQLEKIFEVVNYSPTGVNLQMNKWVMICDTGVINQLSNAVI